MKTIIATTISFGFLISSAMAAAPAGSPAGSTGLCNDGSYSSAAEKKGACRGHKGVKDWYGEAMSTGTPAASGKSTAGTTPMAADAAATTTPRAMPTTSTTPAMPTGARPAPTAAVRTPSANDSMAAAPGGGPGMVWGNENSKVYHCSGDKYYGKTKKGEYMSENDAKAKGYHADHGKACG